MLVFLLLTGEGTYWVLLLSSALDAITSWSLITANVFSFLLSVSATPEVLTPSWLDEVEEGAEVGPSPPRDVLREWGNDVADSAAGPRMEVPAVAPPAPRRPLPEASTDVPWARPAPPTSRPRSIGPAKAAAAPWPPMGRPAPPVMRTPPVATGPPVAPTEERSDATSTSNEGCGGIVREWRLLRQRALAGLCFESIDQRCPPTFDPRWVGSCLALAGLVISILALMAW